MRLELRGVTKRFGELTANDAVDLVVEPGQVHCLLGENGAGKSTLMNVLYGLIRPDEGEILLDGEPVRFRGPRDAMRAGIGMVHQHFMLVPVLTVAENVVLGDEPVRSGFLDRATAASRVAEVSARFGFDLDPDAVVGDLPVGVQQRVEIIKALVRDARVLILDEPTAVLTPQETDELLSIMRGLAEAGTGIVFITHKLREVAAVADAVTVLRRGRVVGTAEPGADPRELASLMVGRDVDLAVDTTGVAEPGAVRLSTRGLTVVDETGRTVLDGVDLDVRSGEILAVAGVQGNGQTELAECILGRVRATAGTVVLDGAEITRARVREVLGVGVGFVPEDRSTDGLVSSFSVAENLVLDLYDTEPFGSGVAYSPRAVARNAAQRLTEFDIRASGPDAPASSLSGGNQQKVVLARELSRPLRLLVASQPTRGLDVGSIEFVHRRLVAERGNGTAVLIVSTELDEVMALADRIAVMYRGRVVGVVPGDTPREVLGLMMAGMTPAEARAAAGSAA